MNQYKKRLGNLYRTGQKYAFRISRSKIDLFLSCPRCFYLDRKLGLGRPSMPGFALNSAVDALLKKEFDLLRQKGQTHELMKRYKIDAVPLAHPKLKEWRDDFYQFKGACVRHEPTNLEICGIIDDLWVNKKGELLVVDYKSTSTSKAISLEDEYKQMYKKQMEVYQWIFRKLGFQVSHTGYFVFANAGRNRPKFDGRLEFALQILTYRGNDSWVEPTLFNIKKCLEARTLPAPAKDCEYCDYRQLIKKEEKS